MAGYCNMPQIVPLSTYVNRMAIQCYAILIIYTNLDNSTTYYSPVNLLATLVYSQFTAWYRPMA